MMKTVTESQFGGWKETDIAETLRYSLGSIGGGSEVLVVVPLEHYRQETTKESGTNMSKKGN